MLVYCGDLKAGDTKLTIHKLNLRSNNVVRVITIANAENTRFSVSPASLSEQHESSPATYSEIDATALEDNTNFHFEEINGCPERAWLLIVERPRSSKKKQWRPKRSHGKFVMRITIGVLQDGKNQYQSSVLS